MDKEEYKNLVKKKYPKQNKLKNMFIAFVVGGSLGLIGQIISRLLVILFGMSVKVSYSVVCLITIFLASLFTGLNFFDDWVTKTKCGLIVPTTGFAHSITSCGLEYKKDGMITGLGANFFKLAGSVLLYGIISAFILCVIKVVFYG
ncbi:MAG: SpoVA/SpoVAEb family sporulation membrane protein [Bacilli bacterium]